LESESVSAGSAAGVTVSGVDAGSIDPGNCHPVALYGYADIRFPPKSKFPLLKDWIHSNSKRAIFSGGDDMMNRPLSHKLLL